ncbi:MAG: GTP-binding protein, partial [Candidatus Hodarchaeales archaeon]
MSEKNRSTSTAESYIEILEKVFNEARDLGTEGIEKIQREIDIKEFADKDIILKTVLIGDGAVGKTSIRNSYMGKKFQPTYMATIGADFAVKDINIYANKIVRFQIWDLAGQQRFDSIRDTYYLGAHVAMIVFDHTRPDSFLNIPKWLNELWIHNGSGPIPFVILGNKTDLIDKSDEGYLNT